jgi:UDP-glucose-4-epimerase GalE
MGLGPLPPSILVTCGAGYVGSHACKALAGAGYTPVTLDNLVYGHRRAVRWGPFVQGDLADGALVRRVLREHHIAAVLHFAGFGYVGESMTAPGKYFQNNFSNSATLLDAMMDEHVNTIVFSSTCATYGIPQRCPIDEDHAQHPVNPYGESKLFVERMLQRFDAAHGLRYAALRYFNAAGADADGEIGEDHEPETHLIPLVIDAALGRRPEISVLGTDYPTTDGTAVRDYVHVSDLALAHVQALRRLQAGDESMRVNLGTGQGHSVREVIKMVEAISGRRVPAKDAPRRPGDPPELVAASARAHAVLGWSPQHSDLRNIIATAWRWHSSRSARERAVAAAD